MPRSGGDGGVELGTSGGGSETPEEAAMNRAAELLTDLEKTAREEAERTALEAARRADEREAGRASIGAPSGARSSLPGKAVAAPKEKKRKPRKDDLAIGQVVFYKHHHHGWIFAKVTSIDYAGGADGGATYVIEAPQISGVLETERKKLFTSMPTA